MARKTDKECAQTLIAGAIVSRGDQATSNTIAAQNLTPEEMVRGAAYIESGKKITGPSH